VGSSGMASTGVTGSSAHDDDQMVVVDDDDDDDEMMMMMLMMMMMMMMVTTMTAFCRRATGGFEWHGLHGRDRLLGSLPLVDPRGVLPLRRQPVSHTVIVINRWATQLLV
jgi:hypothetical protein